MLPARLPGANFERVLPARLPVHINKRLGMPSGTVRSGKLKVDILLVHWTHDPCSQVLHGATAARTTQTVQVYKTNLKESNVEPVVREHFFDTASSGTRQPKCHFNQLAPKHYRSH